MRSFTRSHRQALLAVLTLMVSLAVSVESSAHVAHAEVAPACRLTKPAASGDNFALTGAGALHPLFRTSTGTLRTGTLFVDFADHPGGTESAAPIASTRFPDAASWFTDVSRGRLSLDVSRHRDQWLRMPKPMAQYGFADGLTFAEHKAFFDDAASVASVAGVGLSSIDVLYVVLSSGSFSGSAAFHGSVSGTSARSAVSFGDDLRLSWGANVVVHETLHTFGLPDMYELGAAYPQLHRFIGSWDPMGWLGLGTMSFAWTQAHLGWLDADQVVCAAAGSSSTYTLRPLEITGGLKAVVVRTSASTAIVAENRQAIGRDGALCDRGLLVYRVDTGAVTGHGPVTVLPAFADQDTDAVKLNACELRYNATYDARPGKVDTFVDTASGTTMSVLSSAAGGDLTVRVTTSGAAPTVTNGAFVALQPERLLDTRPGAGQLGYTGATPGPGQTVTLRVTGVGTSNVPVTAAAVALNVTGVDPTADGFVTVWPCDEQRPNSSNLNLVLGRVSPNMVITKVSSAGTVCLFTQSGTDLVADLSGYVAAGTAFVAVQPERLLETRAAVGQVGYDGAGPTAGTTVKVQITGAGTTRIPATARAVVVNLTGVDAAVDGYVTAYPCDADRPLASNLNLVRGGTRPNLAVVKLSADGSICLFDHAGADLLVDVAGYLTSASTFTGVQPERLLETRVDGQVGFTGSKPAVGAVVEVQVVGAGATRVPASAAAVVLNVTGIDGTAGGFVTVWPCGTERPTASNLNLDEGQVAPNLVVVKIGAGGRVCVFTQSGTHLAVDVAGWFG